MPALSRRGWRSVAPDLLGFGTCPANCRSPGSASGRSRTRRGLGLGARAPGVHDWGGLIGLWWTCEHPEAERLVISAPGFFPDGRWHGLAKAARTPGTGEEMVEGMTREGFAAVLRENGLGLDDAAIEEYFKAFGDEDRRRGQLEFRARPTSRSWSPTTAGSPSSACPPWSSGARRTRSRSCLPRTGCNSEIPGSELVFVEGAGTLPSTTPSGRRLRWPAS